ncbi:MAG: hypothetical protein EZS28_027990 [Streblomastix strix]|uniref:Uncharacterized protein n=1 Tax=Streblomastix strix TaxID=222440 RepID=A0A5J4V1Y8_9EUKA|nr:MAG: hypothetical protein EZS28_027990 [Streblomastix strix]
MAANTQVNFKLNQSSFAENALRNFSTDLDQLAARKIYDFAVSKNDVSLNTIFDLQGDLSFHNLLTIFFLSTANSVEQVIVNLINWKSEIYTLLDTKNMSNQIAKSYSPTILALLRESRMVFDIIRSTLTQIIGKYSCLQDEKSKQIRQRQETRSHLQLLCERISIVVGMLNAVGIEIDEKVQVKHQITGVVQRLQQLKPNNIEIISIQVDLEMILQQMHYIHIELETDNGVKTATALLKTINALAEVMMQQKRYFLSQLVVISVAIHNFLLPIAFHPRNRNNPNISKKASNQTKNPTNIPVIPPPIEINYRQFDDAILQHLVRISKIKEKVQLPLHMTSMAVLLSCICLSESVDLCDKTLDFYAFIVDFTTKEEIRPLHLDIIIHSTHATLMAVQKSSSRLTPPKFNTILNRLQKKIFTDQVLEREGHPLLVVQWILAIASLDLGQAVNLIKILLKDKIDVSSKQTLVGLSALSCISERIVIDDVLQQYALSGESNENKSQQIQYQSQQNSQFLDRRRSVTGLYSASSSSSQSSASQQAHYSPSSQLSNENPFTSNIERERRIQENVHGRPRLGSLQDQEYMQDIPFDAKTGKKIDLIDEECNCDYDMFMSSNDEGLNEMSEIDKKIKKLSNLSQSQKNQMYSQQVPQVFPLYVTSSLPLPPPNEKMPITASLILLRQNKLIHFFSSFGSKKLKKQNQVQSVKINQIPLQVIIHNH